MTFDLEVTLPGEWDAVSQGERTLHGLTKKKSTVRWKSPEPQEEIYLVAAKFIEYDKPAGNVSAMAFLRTPDQALAAKYLDATARYLTLYDRLIGPYPYKKFALVENFWETGFGMPSFTLLGSEGHPPAVHHQHLLSPRDPAQLVGQQRVSRTTRRATGPRGSPRTSPTI